MKYHFLKGNLGPNKLCSLYLTSKEISIRNAETSMFPLLQKAKVEDSKNKVDQALANSENGAGGFELGDFLSKTAANHPNPPAMPAGASNTEEGHTSPPGLPDDDDDMVQDPPSPFLNRSAWRNSAKTDDVCTFLIEKIGKSIFHINNAYISYFPTYRKTTKAATPVQRVTTTMEHSTSRWTTTRGI